MGIVVNVLILNQTFHPDVAATAQHMWDLARHLERSGHRVDVITSIAFYGSNRRHELAEESYGNIHVHRVGQTSLGKKSLLRRLADFGSFYLSSYRKLRKMRPDVILALTSPPMIAMLAAWHRGKRIERGSNRRVKFVYHVMDLYPDAAAASGMLKETSLGYRVAARLSRWTLRKADAVIALGTDMADRIEHRYGPIKPGVMSVVTPWADGSELAPLPHDLNPLRKELGLEASFNIVYSGNLGIAHDLETIEQAIAKTADQPDLKWIFIGGGKRFDTLRQKAQSAGWKHVLLMGYQDRDKLIQSLSMADVHLVSQLPAFTGVVVPSKLFGIMAVARPAVMVGPADCECARIIAKNDAGRVIANGDADGLVQAIVQLRDDPQTRRTLGTNARAAFERDHDQSVTCLRIEQILQRVCDRPE